MNKIVAFGLNQEQRVILINVTALRGIDVIFVDSENYGQIIEDLCENNIKPVFNKPALKAMPKESMLLLCDFSEQELDYFLEAGRQNKLLVDYKAVLTKTNARWTALQLFAEMAIEKLAYQMRK